MILPTKLDFEAFKGATFNPALVWSDDCDNVYDLTSYSAKMQVRLTKSTPDPPIISLTSTTNLTLTNVVGNFSFGDFVTGQTSNAIGYVVSYNSTTFVLELSRVAGIFLIENLVDSTSGATATISLVNNNGGIILGAVAPNISFFIPATITADITILTGVYDLFITDANDVTSKLLYGKITFWPSVTE
jgi:hypothetical protein